MTDNLEKIVRKENVFGKIGNLFRSKLFYIPMSILISFIAFSSIKKSNAFANPDKVSSSYTIDGTVTNNITDEGIKDLLVELRNLPDSTVVGSGLTNENGYYSFSFTGVPEINNDKFNFKLNQNFPNPFSDVTLISYSLPSKSFVDLSVYNITGQLVENLVREQQDKGNHSVKFNSKDLSSGVYFYVLKTDNSGKAKKMILVKVSGINYNNNLNFSKPNITNNENSMSINEKGYRYIFSIKPTSSSIDIYEYTTNVTINKDTVIDKEVIKRPNEAVEYALAKGFTLDDYGILSDISLLQNLDDKNKKIAIDISYMNKDNYFKIPWLSSAMQDGFIENIELSDILNDTLTNFKAEINFNDSLSTYYAPLIPDSIMLSRELDDINHQIHGGIPDSLIDIVDNDVYSLSNPTLLDIANIVQDDVQLWADKHQGEWNCVKISFKIAPLVRKYIQEFNFDGSCWNSGAIADIEYYHNFDHELIMLFDGSSDTIYYINSTGPDFDKWGEGWYFSNEPSGVSGYTWGDLLTLSLEYEQAKDRAGILSAKREVVFKLSTSDDIDYFIVPITDYLTATDIICANICDLMINNGLNDEVRGTNRKIKSAVESDLTNKGFKYIISFSNNNFKFYGVDLNTFNRVTNGDDSGF